MSDREELLDAFEAGFRQSAEGFNAEYGASESDVKQRFDEWMCTHDFGGWKHVNDSISGDKKLYQRKCSLCGATKRKWISVGENDE